jgi:acyl-homoserine-lactone acylase
MSRLIPFLFLACVIYAPAQVTDLSYIRKDSIQIARDEWGVPHIYAPTDAEVAYGLAWAHCEDDFASIQEFLLTVTGFSGRRNGLKGVKMDYAVGLLRADKLIAEEYDKQLDPATQKYLRAYAAGISRYAATHPEEVLIKKAFPITEFDLAASIQLGLSMFAGVEKAFYYITEEKLPQASPNKVTAGGSSAFAVHASKTPEGKSYIALNPHVPLEGVLSWYEVHLVSGEGLNFMGAVFPGACFPGVGVNENIAWGQTVAHPDLIDLYRLEMHPEKKNLYRFDGEWIELESAPVHLKAKLPVFNICFGFSKKAWWSVYGPTLKTDRGTYSFRMPTQNLLAAPRQSLEMARARNYSEFMQALSLQSIPCFNLVYADRFDTIMYLSNAVIPYRNPDYDWSKMLPGDTSATLWEMKFHPTSELPMSLNPPSGYVFNANHSPFLCTHPDDNPNPANYDPTMGIQPFHNNRSVRLDQLFQEAAADGEVSWEEFFEIKYDCQYPDSFHFPYSINKVLRADPADYPDIAGELARIQRWDRRGDTSNVEASMVALTLTNIIGSLGVIDYSMNYIPVMPDSIVIASVKKAGAYLMKHFGSLDVPFGALQRLRRDDVDLAMPGMPDQILCMFSKPRPDGTLAPFVGDSYIMMVKMGGDGPEIQTIHPYGASARKGNPHATDQMPLFVKRQFKPMSLDWEEAKRKAKRVYSPG